MFNKRYFFLYYSQRNVQYSLLSWPDKPHTKKELSSLVSSSLYTFHFYIHHFLFPSANTNLIYLASVTTFFTYTQKFFVSSVHLRGATLFHFDCSMRDYLLLCLRHTSPSFQLSPYRSLDFSPPAQDRLTLMPLSPYRGLLAPTSNPAGHQLGCASVIQPAIPTPPPPFPLDDTPPHRGHVSPVHLSSSESITVEASLAPEGPPISGQVSLIASKFPWEVHAYSHQPLPWEAPDGTGTMATYYVEAVLFSAW